MRRGRIREPEEMEIAPSKIYYIFYEYDGDIIPLKQYGHVREFYDLNEAGEVAKWLKSEKGYKKVKIEAIPFDSVNDYYGGARGGRKIKYPDDELEHSRVEDIYRRGGGAMEAYLKGFRKKKTTSKPKRKIVKKPVKKCRCK